MSQPTFAFCSLLTNLPSTRLVLDDASPPSLFIVRESMLTYIYSKASLSHYRLVPTLGSNTTFVREFQTPPPLLSLQI